jgi:hypothetical protein
VVVASTYGWGWFFLPSFSLAGFRRGGG